MKTFSLSMTWVAFLLVSPVLPAQDAKVPAKGEQVAPRAAPRAAQDTVAALRRAAQVLAEAKGLKGASRADALEKAALAYEQVAAEYATDLTGSAQAWFEAAEAWRRHGTLDKAEAAYRKALELDADRYGARALLEVASGQRRQKRFDAALESYRKVAVVKPETSRNHEARLWVGRCLQTMGQLAEAITAFRQAVDATQNPRQVIEAANWLAKALIAGRDFDGAATAIQRAEQSIAKAVGQDAERLRDLAANMSARRELQRARDKGAKAHQDAEALEKDSNGPERRK